MTERGCGMSVSVAMAAYNGEKFIAAQIDSILLQLSDYDELVISYNESIDDTWKILQRYASFDPRIRVVKCLDRGVLSNFQNAIKYCVNAIIFLSDQDDVWVENKINTVLRYFENPNIGAVCHSSILVDEELVKINCINKYRKNFKDIRPMDILWKNPIQGNCFAFRCDFKQVILPFPRCIPMHDSWIGILIATYSRIIFIDDQLLYYRQHNGNVTSRHHKKLMEMLRDRLMLLKEYIFRRWRFYKQFFA